MVSKIEMCPQSCTYSSSSLRPQEHCCLIVTRHLYLQGSKVKQSNFVMLVLQPTFTNFSNSLILSECFSSACSFFFFNKNPSLFQDTNHIPLNSRRKHFRPIYDCISIDMYTHVKQFQCYLKMHFNRSHCVDISKALKKMLPGGRHLLRL